MADIFDVVIIGAGPAGATAGLYTSRAGFSTIIIEKENFGGELVNREMIENYPGFPSGILGPELGSNMVTQAQNYGTQVQFGEVESIIIEKTYQLVKTPQGDYQSKALIIANGAHPKKLGVPGELEFADKGVFYCATCDGPRFAGKKVAVVGGGDSGVTESLLLAGMGAKVIILEIMPKLNATKTLIERVQSNPAIETTCGVKVDAIRGDDSVKAIDITEVKTGQKSSLPVEGILVWVGLQANTEFLKNAIPLDERGQILVDNDMKTLIPGIFAAGDIRHNSPMQITTAVGDGATAALSAGKYIRNG